MPQSPTSSHESDSYEKLMSIDEIIKSHQNNIQITNTRVNGLFQHYIKQSRTTYWLTIVFFVSFTIISIILIAIGIQMAFLPNSGTFLHLFSALSTISGIFLILLLLFNNPLRITRRSLNELMKINIIFSGYTRQIYQIDAEFKKALIQVGSNEAEIKSLAKRVNIAVQQAIDTLMVTVDEFIE